ncbi:NF-X1-type zinc finger protein NFXL1 [Thrips palmi]|uniref:NF-X1-type zinc finger protein NFXL1 n=1 Tax=Thrips palmi TaxID=161013 RepID=A0A6P9ADI5_THRPL|nr:NF-X1-type zinc finger protein NFXL1 [Thrips palmi]
MERAPRDGGSRPNPWHQKRGGGAAAPGGGGGGGSKRGPSKKQGGSKNSGNLQTNRVEEKSSIAKFEEARLKMEQAAKKHFVSDYQSSDEEDDVQIDPIVGAVLETYAAMGGVNADLGRTQHFLEEAFQSGAATCLICIGSVKRIDPVWSCSACFCFLHLTCTQRWAKDSLLHQKNALEDLPRDKHPLKITWPCPKCRKEYESNDVPQRYYCFCGQKEDPAYHAWLVPHSCGETCGRPLQPACGHTCLLLCHPGPCPPCPKTVRVPCHCKKENPRPQRCSQKSWSCGSQCSAVLSCGSHRCSAVCHPGLCEACPRKSEQLCACGSQRQNRPCASPFWQCEKVCGKRLSCKHHSCEKVCHSGPCGACPLSENRSCPCGKISYKILCTEEIAPCGDTCNRILNCGVHACPERCHKDKCGTCLEVTVKQCRCGLHTKELPCAKEFLCETKCKRSKDCGRHPCNRKCCDTQCPPCEKVCGRTLTCGQHKCESVCHRGPCYPCPVTASVSCNCGASVIHVPCGRQRRTRAPRCSKLCLNPPECHHKKREDHACHFGHCPPCTQVCNMQHSQCGHNCSKPCHSAVWMKVERQAPAGPWELAAPQLVQRNLPCPPCSEPLQVICLGKHDTTTMPCHAAKSMSCGKKCGRNLKCTNHLCDLECHTVNGDEDCETCENACELPRTPGCPHECPLPCHPAPCPPCRATLRPRCHCGVTQVYIKCAEWTKPGCDRVALTSCGSPCPKSFPCGHKCTALCHPGDCPDADKCAKKTKAYCPCRRVKKEVRCDILRSAEFSLPCDETCEVLKLQKEKSEVDENKKRRAKEEEEARIEAERFQKRMEGTGRRKTRNRNQNEMKDDNKRSAFFYLSVTAVVIVFVAILYFQLS